METIAGFPVEELKRLGLSDEDIVFIRDNGVTYRRVVTAKVVVPQSPASVVEIASNVFEQGMIVGIARGRGLMEVAKRIGF